MTTINDKPDYSLYSNAFGFLRQPLDFSPQASDAELIISGVPFDLATTGRPGSRLGPNAIRQASVHLAWEAKRFPWSFDLRKKVKIADCGDLVFDCGDAAQMSERLEQHALQLLKHGKTLLTFGGDHFITLPLLRAHAKHFGKLALLHFDAHTDTYSLGGKFDHGTMFYHAPKEGLIDPQKSIQLGIRTEYSDTLGFNVIEGSQVNELSAEAIAKRIHEVIGDTPTYLTFDIDCLDPAYAPGTGTPVCGGVTTDKALKIIRALDKVNIVGMDLVEVAPAYDHGEITALAGATIALELLYRWCANQQQLV
jgi:agmatinase